MLIRICDNQHCFKINHRTIKRALANTLREEKYPPCELSVTLVDNKQIKQINRRYLKRNETTDVISFTLKGKEDNVQDKLLGEIVVSVEKAVEEARIRQIAPAQEILLYCIHGLLHLLGYDDLSPRARKQMNKRQTELLLAFAGKM
jgi:probable rRNA maturation factor